MTEKRKNSGARLTAEEFVLLWQKSKTFRDFVQASGMRAASAKQRAVYYRKKGIKLKLFRPGPEGLNWRRLRKVARENAPN